MSIVWLFILIVFAKVGIIFRHELILAIDHHFPVFLLVLVVCLLLVLLISRFFFIFVLFPALIQQRWERVVQDLFAVWPDLPQDVKHFACPPICNLI